MATSSQQNTSEPDWKDRYYKSLNELELKEQDWQRDKEALLNTVVKLGNAYQDSNPKVTQALGVVKKSLQENTDNLPVAEIDNIVYAVLNQAANDENNSFSYFIEELCKIDHFSESFAFAKEKLAQLTNTAQEIELIDECIANLINVAEENIDTSGNTQQNFDDALALLDWLSLNQKYQKHLNKLKLQLANIDSADNAKSILKRIAMLISNAYMEVQNEVNELEAFLKKVTHQLGTLTLALSETESFHEDSLSQRKTQNTEITEKLLSMQSEVEHCQSVDQVKSVISDSINVLQNNMDSYLDSESERIQETINKNSELKQRIEAMEQETDKLRTTLTEEKQRSITDALTGIANRLAFDERLKQELERFERYKQNLTICLIDIDKFKHVNDTYGHKAGDKVLKIVAEKCNARVRKSDFFARYGGEEFALILPETSLENASKIAEDLRAEIDKARFHYQGDDVPVTISCGLSSFKINDESDQVFERADKALYQAKNDGRNLVRVYE